jgi:hypothetical protein
MGGLYAYLIDAGYQAEYLDHCTLLDIDLFASQTNELRKKQGWKPA